MSERDATQTEARTRLASRLALAAAALLLLAATSAGAYWHSDASAALRADVARALRQPALRLAEVDFVGLEALDAEALWQRLDVAADTPLIDLEPAAIERALLEHPRVARSSALRLPPNRLLIGVRERTPVALDADSLEGVDVHGARFAIAPAEMAGLPRLRGDAAAALALLEAAGAHGVEVTEVRAESAANLRFRPAGREVWLVAGARPARALARWQQLRDSAPLARFAPGEIDLRFEGSAVFRRLSQKEGEDHGSQ